MNRWRRHSHNDRVAVRISSHIGRIHAECTDKVLSWSDGSECDVLVEIAAAVEHVTLGVVETARVDLNI